MFTYQLQDRRFMVKEGGPPAFPSHSTVRFTLEPAPALGAAEGPVSFILRGSSVHIYYNANTGRSFNRPSPPLTSLEAECRWPNAIIRLEGQVLSYDFECPDLATLAQRTETLFYLLPALLSAKAPEAVVITNTSCLLGGTRLNWELKETTIPLAVRSKGDLEDRLGSSLASLPTLSDPGNRRAAAALHYVHTARRLLAAGTSPWEFTAEAILSFNKALEVLFGDRRDDQRAGLAQLGYDSSVIERTFIPLVLVRDWLDVAHPRLAVLKASELQGLYRYLARLEATMAEFTERLLSQTAEGRLRHVPAGDLQLDREHQRALDLLLAIVSGNGDGATL